MELEVSVWTSYFKYRWLDIEADIRMSVFLSPFSYKVHSFLGPIITSCYAAFTHSWNQCRSSGGNIIITEWKHYHLDQDIFHGLINILVSQILLSISLMVFSTIVLHCPILYLTLRYKSWENRITSEILGILVITLLVACFIICSGSPNPLLLFFI